MRVLELLDFTNARMRMIEVMLRSAHAEGRGLTPADVQVLLVLTQSVQDTQERLGRYLLAR